MEEASIPVILLALGELEAVSQNLGGKGETADYPELRLLYHHLQRLRVRWPWARAVIGQS